MLTSKVYLTDKLNMNKPRNSTIGHIGSNRRRFQRIKLSRVVKIQCMSTGRYMPARTIDLCPKGVLLDMPQHTTIKAGQQIKLGLTLSTQQPILNSDALITATVVRSESSDLEQQLALEFEVEQKWLCEAA